MTGIERCKQEIAAMQEQDESAPAWLVTLGISDWEDEMRLLEGCEEDTC